MMLKRFVVIFSIIALAYYEVSSAEASSNISAPCSFFRDQQETCMYTLPFYEDKSTEPIVGFISADKLKKDTVFKTITTH